jgi:type II secretory ATPase GspE/PulE/Tfp pilus assembly ATPase PilB-like protein
LLRLLPAKSIKGSTKYVLFCSGRLFSFLLREIMNYRSGFQKEIDVVQKVNDWIYRAYHSNASDIHVEPMRDKLQVRMRIDGELEILDTVPSENSNAVLSRIKIMSGIDVNERRKPQDGRFSAEEYSKRGVSGLDMRVSSNPTYYGEKIVLRLIDKTKLKKFSLQDLGFSEKNIESYRKCINCPYGMILHVGPTGSGKTTTMYAAIREIIKVTININTVEDPIEYTLPGVCHTQIHHDIGLTFPRVLRALLRQDPDVIMVGEIRDQETALIAVEAAMTGHLIFSTLHTNSAVGAVSRLMDMGVSPYFVAHALLIVVSQRFARRLCPCKIETELSDAILGVFSPPENRVVYDHKVNGCSRCQRKGYKGRIALMEVLAMSEAIRLALVEGKGEDVLNEIAVREGMDTMLIDGLHKVISGITSPSEVLRAVGGIDKKQKGKKSIAMPTSRMREELQDRPPPTPSDSAIVRPRRPSPGSRVNRGRPSQPGNRPRGIPRRGNQ